MCEEETNTLDRVMNFAFNLRKFEITWLPRWLEPLSRAGWFDTVLYRVKSGKEAMVYCCEANPSTGLDLLAAKVYLPPRSRSSKYYGEYNIGRDLLDEYGQPRRGKRRTSNRRKKRTRDEKHHLDEISWLQHEYQTQCTVYDAGAKVPQPLAVNNNAVLMSYVGNHRQAAPTLQSLALNPLEAGDLFTQILDQIALFLSLDRIHGDLSAYNILVWNNDFSIIDFPQAINAQTHPRAFHFLHRDIDRVYRYFQKSGIEADARKFARAMWHRYVNGQMQSDLVPG